MKNWKDRVKELNETFDKINILKNESNKFMSVENSGKLNKMLSDINNSLKECVYLIHNDQETIKLHHKIFYKEIDGVNTQMQQPTQIKYPNGVTVERKEDEDELDLSGCQDYVGTIIEIYRNDEFYDKALIDKCGVDDMGKFYVILKYF